MRQNERQKSSGMVSFKDPPNAAKNSYIMDQEYSHTVINENTGESSLQP
jgi:hypothetical protein